MPGEPSNYTDIGGGGDLKPHGEDYFNRIVAVHWPKKDAPVSENIFVLGDYGAFNCFVGGVEIDPSTPGKATFTTTPLGTLDFGGKGESWTTGSSSHTFRSTTPGGDDRTVFVLCGWDSVSDSSGTNQGVIMASSDGLSWSKVYVLAPKFPSDDPSHDAESYIQGVVWDGAFYAAGHQSTRYYEHAEHGDTGGYLLIRQEESDILLRSSDGFSWGEVGRSDNTTWLPGVDVPPPTRRGRLVAHCRNRGIIDIYGNPVPDGMYHYSLDSDTQLEIFIRPNRATATIGYDFGSMSFGSDTAATSVLIDVKEGGNVVTSKVSSPGISIMAVGYSNGIIIAVGGDHAVDGRGPSLFAVSCDMGDTWTTGSYAGYPPGFTVTGKNALTNS